MKYQYNVKVVLEPPPPGRERSIFFEGGWLYLDLNFIPKHWKIYKFLRSIFEKIWGGGSISTVVIIRPLRYLIM